MEWASLVGKMAKNLPAVQETRAWSLGWENPLKKEIATHFGSLAWGIPWTENWWTTIHGVSKELDTTDRLTHAHTHTHTHTESHFSTSLLVGRRAHPTFSALRSTTSFPKWSFILLHGLTQPVTLFHDQTCLTSHPYSDYNQQSFLFLNIYTFYQSIVDLQCFRCTARWFSYTFIHILFFRLFSIIGFYKILTVVPCAISLCCLLHIF